MKPQYCIICYAGMDLYDHERRVQQVATDYCDEDTIATKFDIYKQHSEKRLDNGTYAWATVCLVKMTANESTVVKHWGQEKPLKEKIQLNKPAKTTKTPLSVAEAIDIWGAQLAAPTVYQTATIDQAQYMFTDIGANLDN